MAAVPSPMAEATAAKTREAPSTVSHSTAVPDSVDSRRKSRNRRKHRGRRSRKSRSPYDFESSSESSPTSVSDLRSMIGVRDLLRLEVRDGGRRVSLESRGRRGLIVNKEVAVETSRDLGLWRTGLPPLAGAAGEGGE